MKISTRGRYGLRILLDLALYQTDKPRMIRDIAESQQISEKYISRLMIELRQGGLVRSVRGAKGGYCLARSPQDLSILEIVEVMEGRIGVVDCLAQPDACNRANVCPSRNVWNQVNDKIRQTLAAVSLQQLIDGEGCEI